MKRLTIYIIFLLISNLLLEGCSRTIYKMCHDANRPIEEIAILKGGGTVFLCWVDGQKIGSLCVNGRPYGGVQCSDGFEVHLLPGPHSITVSYTSTYAIGYRRRETRSSVGSISINFEAKPGHIYHVSYEITGNTWRPYIEDKTKK